MNYWAFQRDKIETQRAVMLCIFKGFEGLRKPFILKNYTRWEIFETERGRRGVRIPTTREGITNFIQS